MTHYLKTLPHFFKASLDQVKTFDLRFNDRNYKVGDLIHLKEWDPKKEKFTGREIVREVRYILDTGDPVGKKGLRKNYAILALTHPKGD